MRIALPITSSALSLMFFCAPACAANHVVVVGGTGFVYTPNSLTIPVGDTVTFTNIASDGGGGFHNIDNYGDSVATFRCSNDCSGGSNSGPSGNGWSQTLTFGTPGTVKFHCDQHGSITGAGAATTCSGMCGTITVQGSVPVRLQSFEVD